MVDFKKLTAEHNGQVVVLYEDGEYKNFDWLHELVGEKYDSLNDELMEGISGNGEEYTFFIWKDGEATDSIQFRFDPV